MWLSFLLDVYDNSVLASPKKVQVYWIILQGSKNKTKQTNILLKRYPPRTKYVALLLRGLLENGLFYSGSSTSSHI